MRSEKALQTNTWIATSVRMMAISRARCHKLTMLIPLILALWMTGCHGTCDVETCYKEYGNNVTRMAQMYNVTAGWSVDSLNATALKDICTTMNETLTSCVFNEILRSNCSKLPFNFTLNTLHAMALCSGGEPCGETKINDCYNKMSYNLTMIAEMWNMTTMDQWNSTTYHTVCRLSKEVWSRTERCVIQEVSVSNCSNHRKSQLKDVLERNSEAFTRSMHSSVCNYEKPMTCWTPYLSCIHAYNESVHELGRVYNIRNQTSWTDNIYDMACSKFLDIVDSLEQCLVDIAAANSNCTLKENDHWQTTFKDFLYQVQNGLKPTICSRNHKDSCLSAAMNTTVTMCGIEFSLAMKDVNYLQDRQYCEMQVYDYRQCVNDLVYSKCESWIEIMSYEDLTTDEIKKALNGSTYCSAIYTSPPQTTTPFTTVNSTGNCDMSKVSLNVSSCLIMFAKQVSELGNITDLNYACSVISSANHSLSYCVHSNISGCSYTDRVLFMEQLQQTMDIIRTSLASCRNTTDGPCSNFYCFNGGSCVSPGGYAMCHCHYDYTGKYCESHSNQNGACDSGYCRNGGTCYYHEGNPYCHCEQPPNFGDTCEKWMDTACDSSPCYGNASCESYSQLSFKCHCPVGYSGITCKRLDWDHISFCPDQYTDPSLQPCHNGGTCFETQYDEKVCLCFRGYTGKYCDAAVPDYHDCDKRPCSLGATCIQGSDYFSYQCLCPPGKTGELCEEDVTCSNFECSNGGSCQMSAYGYPYCLCQPGFSGENCDIGLSCFNTGCVNGGSCLAEYAYNSSSTFYYCACPGGTTGQRCETKYSQSCNDVGCRNGGTCYPNYPYGSGYYCACPTDTTGALCEIHNATGDCYYQGCENGGSCLTDYYNNSNYCSCKYGTSGIRCEIIYGSSYSICYDQQPCVNNATCVDDYSGYSYTCFCQQWFAGPNCSINLNDTTCASSPCQNGGTCGVSSYYEYDSYNSSISCECPYFYSGMYCETYTNTCEYMYDKCENGGTCMEQYGQAYCVCPYGYTGYRCREDLTQTTCSSHPCLNGGTCQTTVYSLYGYYCECDQGFDGEHCEEVVEACKLQPCMHGGHCWYYDVYMGQTEVTCGCTRGYTGSRCESSVNPVSHPVDKNMCEDQNPCHNGGVCLNFGSHYRCICTGYFTGDHCDRYTGLNTIYCTMKNLTGRANATLNNFTAVLEVGMHSLTGLEQVCLNRGVYVSAVDESLSTILEASDCNVHSTTDYATVEKWGQLVNDYISRFNQLDRRCGAVHNAECKNLDDAFANCSVATNEFMGNKEYSNLTFQDVCRQGEYLIMCMQEAMDKCPELADRHRSMLDGLARSACLYGCSFTSVTTQCSQTGCNMLKAAKCFNPVLSEFGLKVFTEYSYLEDVSNYMENIKSQASVFCMLSQDELLENAIDCVLDYEIPCTRMMEDITDSMNGRDRNKREIRKPASTLMGMIQAAARQKRQADSTTTSSDISTPTGKYTTHAPQTSGGKTGTVPTAKPTGKYTTYALKTATDQGKTLHTDKWQTTTSYYYYNTTYATPDYENSTGGSGSSGGSESSEESYVPFVSFFKDMNYVKYLCTPSCGGDYSEVERRIHDLESCYSGDLEYKVRAITRAYNYGDKGTYTYLCSEMSDIGRCVERVANDCLLVEDHIIERYNTIPGMWHVVGICNYHSGIDLSRPVAAFQSACLSETQAGNEIEECLENHVTSLTHSYLTKYQACRILQDEIDCHTESTKGCWNLLHKYITPRIYAWAQLNNAWNCRLTMNNVSLEFMDKESCSFHRLYSCHAEVFDNLGISVSEYDVPSTDVAGLQRWLRLKDSVLVDSYHQCRNNINPFTKHVRSSNACEKRAHSHCLRSLPLIKGMPMENDNPKEHHFPLTNRTGHDAVQQALQPGYFSRITEYCHADCNNLTPRVGRLANCYNPHMEDSLEVMTAEIVLADGRGATTYEACSALIAFRCQNLTSMLTSKVGPRAESLRENQAECIEIARRMQCMMSVTQTCDVLYDEAEQVFRDVPEGERMRQEICQLDWEPYTITAASDAIRGAYGVIMTTLLMVVMM